MVGYYIVFGGGAGDVWWCALEDPRMTWLPGLVEDYGYRIRIYSVCHCPGTADLFWGQPHIHEVLTEEWRLPNAEDTHRFSHPIDGYVPLHQGTVLQFAGPTLRRSPFTFRYSDPERAWADELLAAHRTVCLQPYAGLSDRDGFDRERLDQLCERLVDLDPHCQVLILGRNHDRGHKYAQEEASFQHPRVRNLIDQLSLRMSLYLVSRADAFGGCHSNLIRAAWRWRRRNALVVPTPSMTEALPRLDPQYTFGLTYPETRLFTYAFDNQSPRDFSVLDIDGIARHLLGR